jgi:hypothetical protein
VVLASGEAPDMVKLGGFMEEDTKGKVDTLDVRLPAKDYGEVVAARADLELSQA